MRLERTGTREPTDILVGETIDQRRDSHALAIALYHQRMNEHAARLYKLPSAAPAIRFSKYANEYLPTIKLRKGAERDQEILKTLTAFFSADLLSVIDQERTTQYMTARRAKGIAANTINREVALLKIMLRDAVPKYLSESPIAGMKQLRTIKPRRRLLTVEEERKLLKHADPVERALLIVGIDGLIRLGDLLDLKRGDRRGEWLYVSDPKGNEPYEVVLSTRAQKALDALKGDGAFFFDRYRHSEKMRDRRRSVRRALEKLCARANVPFGKKANGITFHWATRKTGATRLILEKRAPLPAVQRQGNWKTPDVLLSIYAEADREAQKTAILGNTSRSRAKRKSA